MWCYVLYKFIKKLEHDRICLVYFPQLVSISNINYLNKFVFTVTACCLKNICILNLDTFVEVSGRNNHDNCSTPETKKIKWPPFSE